MIDELDLLKKDWKKQEDSLPRVSSTEIYTMLLKKSSSIVKWIFIVSVLEFLLFIGLEISGGLTSNSELYETFGVGKWFTAMMSAISLVIILYFMVQFYWNYKKIQATDSVKTLMENILKTRKTVKKYVFVSLSFTFVLLLFLFGLAIFNSTELQSVQLSSGKEVSKLILGIVFFIISVILVGFAGGIYYLLYGLMTRKLKRNYNELQKLKIE